MSIRTIGELHTVLDEAIEQGEGKTPITIFPARKGDAAAALVKADLNFVEFADSPEGLPLRGTFLVLHAGGLPAAAAEPAPDARGGPGGPFYLDPNDELEYTVIGPGCKFDLCGQIETLEAIKHANLGHASRDAEVAELRAEVARLKGERRAREPKPCHVLGPGCDAPDYELAENAVFRCEVCGKPCCGACSAVDIEGVAVCRKCDGLTPTPQPTETG